MDKPLTSPNSYVYIKKIVPSIAKKPPFLAANIGM
jgi:hypothetical protein